MKISFKNSSLLAFVTCVFAVFAAMSPQQLTAATVTNFTLVSIAGQVATKQIELREGESLGLVQALGNYQPNMAFTYNNVRVDNIGNIPINTSPRDFRRILGPGTVEIYINHEGQASGSYRTILSLEISGTPATESLPIVNIPSNAVVIPADSAGPVQVLLESSVDLITWNSALPGTYATTSSNRFFRVRTVRQ